MALDRDQLQIATHKSGHALVLAGAGSGKTSTIVERSGRLIENSFNPRRMVMMAFTNKAAREMHERLRKYLHDKGYEGSLPTITTFHSFGHRLIRKNPESCGRTGTPSLMDERDQEKLLRTVLKKHHFDLKLSNEIVKTYEQIRNHGYVAGLDADRDPIFKMLRENWDLGRHDSAIYDAFCAYEEEKEKANTMDFHDLITLPIRSLETDHEFRDHIRQYIIDLMIDEAQDTNTAQYRLIKLLAPPDKGQSVMLIGDEDQCIHEWRGAYPENLKLFEKEYAPSIFRLENNYRSLPEIVSGAGNIIRNNPDRYDKNGRPTRPATQTSPIDLAVHQNGETMGGRIAHMIDEAIRNGTRPQDIAVLYRTNRMAAVIEPHLLALTIPYRIYKGIELLDRAENRILIAALRLAVNPFDRQAFEKLSDLIPGLGVARIAKLFDSLPPRTSVFDAALKLPPKALENARPLLQSIIDLRLKGPRHLMKWADCVAIREFLTDHAEDTLKARGDKKPMGFDAWLKQKQGGVLNDEEQERLTNAETKVCENYYQKRISQIRKSVENMKLVAASINERLNLAPGMPLEDQWFEAMEIVNRPPDEEGTQAKVSLMTIHSAKGLEWRVVHVAGFSDGLMPLMDTEGHIENLKEERRLAYVAFTRAKDELYLHHPKILDLKIGKGAQRYQVSRFAAEAEMNAIRGADMQRRTQAGFSRQPEGETERVMMA